jgi:1-deoxy-D-xylulose-5-phosphate reductoisomerase
VTLLGATGSIGDSTVDLLKRERQRFRVEAVTANKNAAALAALAREVGARYAAVGDPAAYGDLKAALFGTGIAAGAGESGLIEAAERPAEWVIGAITGAAGLKPTLAAADRGAIIALANKETLVCAGRLFMRRAAASGATVLPVDSEHNALFQAMSGSRREDVRRVILTASGGPFRTASAEAIRTATVEQALKHPNWSMGAKVTIDSATLMNKGLEVIEARWLFDAGADRIDVLVHPQSIVHSMVELVDGSVIAQLGVTDMRLPIQYAFSYPERWGAPAPALDLARAGKLEFEPPDMARFPCLGLAFRALRGTEGLSIVLNAANEIAVSAFMDGALGFPGIPGVITLTMDAFERQGGGHVAGLADVRAIDGWARAFAARAATEVQSTS